MDSLSDLFVSYKNIEPPDIDKLNESEEPEQTSLQQAISDVQNRMGNILQANPIETDSDDLTGDIMENDIPETGFNLDWIQKKQKFKIGRQRYNRGNLEKELKDLFNEAGIDVRITSGKRPAGAAGKAGSRSNHVYGNAVDITPAEGESFESLRKKLTSNPKILNFFYSNGLGIIDETDPATMKKTGATGKHFHVGPDTWALQTWASWTNGWQPKGTQTQQEWANNLYNAYTKELKKFYGDKYSNSDYNRIAKYMTYQSALESGFGEHANGYNYGGHMDGNKTVHYDTLDSFVKAQVKTLDKWNIMSSTSLKDFVKRLYVGEQKYNPDLSPDNYFARIDGTVGRVNNYLGIAKFGGKFDKIRQIYEDSFSHRR